MSNITSIDKNFKIETNIEKPSFLENLKDLKGAFFVCNFKEQEYYYADYLLRTEKITKENYFKKLYMVEP